MDKHLQQAFEIFSGKEHKPTKEQVVAAVRALLDISKKTEKLHSLMREVLKKANATRQHMGMEIPSPPFKGPKP